MFFLPPLLMWLGIGGGAAAGTAAAGTALAAGEAAVASAAALGGAEVAAGGAALAATALGTANAVGWGTRLLGAGRWAFSALRSGGLLGGGKLGLSAAEQIGTTSRLASVASKVGLAGTGAALGGAGMVVSAAWAAMVTAAVIVGAAAIIGTGGMLLYRVMSRREEKSEGHIDAKPQGRSPEAPSLTQIAQQQPDMGVSQGYWVQRVGVQPAQQASFLEAEEQRRIRQSTRQNRFQY